MEFDAKIGGGVKKILSCASLRRANFFALSSLTIDCAQPSPPLRGTSPRVGGIAKSVLNDMIKSERKLYLKAE